MKYKNIVILFFIFIALLTSVYADKVTIFNFNYDNGQITLKEQIIQDGFYPDRKIQAEGDYNCVLADDSDKEIYSFNFELPLQLYIDSSEDNQIVGKIIVLNETDFSFITPYFEQAKDIVCYNPRGFEILRDKVEKIVVVRSSSNRFLWIYGIIALIGLLIILYKINKNKHF